MLRKQVQLVVVAGIATLIILLTAVILSYREYAALRQEAAVAVELSDGMNDLQYLTIEYMAAPTPRILKQWQARHVRLTDLVGNVLIHDEDVDRIMPEIRTRLDNLKSTFDRLVRAGTLKLAPERAAAAERAIVTRLLNQVLALSTLRSRVSDIYFQREAALQGRLPFVLGAIFIVGVVMAVILYFRILSSLSGNLNRLAAAIMRLGSGKFDEPIDTSHPGDFQPTMQALEQSRERLATAIAQMEQERADLDHFVYVASHDFKAPLRGIDNLASWIEEDSGTGLTPESKEHLTMLRSRVKRLEVLLDDLLAYSRAGRMKIASETVDVAELIQGVADDIGLPKGFRLEYDNGLPTILSPRVPLEHVFHNLIANALKHHDKDEGVIRIEAAEDTSGEGYRFLVIDDGPGVPERYQKRVFEMFQTLQPRDDVEGSGMGLAITKRLVHCYNGDIRIVSGDGRGCTVAFSWFPQRHMEESDG